MRSGHRTKCVQFSFSYIARSCSAEQSTARYGGAAGYEHHAASLPMPRGEHLIPVLCHYSGCNCPSETTANKNWSNACLIRSLQSSNPIFLNLSDSFAKKRRHPKTVPVFLS